MKLYIDFDLRNFEAWSGATDTKNRIIEEGKAEDFNRLVDEIFPDGCSETEMNDFLRFNDDDIYEWLGITEEEENDDGEIEIDFSQYSDFDSFCESFGSGCKGCPLQLCVDGCEETFEELKNESNKE